MNKNQINTRLRLLQFRMGSREFYGLTGPHSSKSFIYTKDIVQTWIDTMERKPIETVKAIMRIANELWVKAKE